MTGAALSAANAWKRLMSEIDELPQETQILMIRASKILQTELKARQTALSNHMVPAKKVASADSNSTLSIAGFCARQKCGLKPPDCRMQALHSIEGIERLKV